MIHVTNAKELSLIINTLCARYFNGPPGKVKKEKKFWKYIVQQQYNELMQHEFLTYVAR